MVAGFLDLESSEKAEKVAQPDVVHKLRLVLQPVNLAIVVRDSREEYVIKVPT